MQDYQIEHNNFMAKLNRSLFTEENRKIHDDTLDMPYIVTVNPAPNKLLNRKKYRLYSEEQQRAMLLRIEAALRRDNPSIKLLELHFEKCPSSGMVHFHALYNMPILFESTMVNYYNRIMSMVDSNTTGEPWRHLDIQICNNKSAWLQYIRKDSVKSFGTKVVKL